MFTRIYSTKINAIANFGSSVWTALLSIAFVPIYIGYMGIESYGLLGLFSSIQAFIVLLDFGLSPTLNRELAHLSTQTENAQEMTDLKRTLEIPNWICSGFIGLFLFLLSPFIALSWVHPQNLSVETITQAMMIMSVNIAMQFSVNFYIGGLMGLQKQLVLNTINIVCATLRFVGAFLVLVFYSPTIKAFLIWNGSILLLQAVLMAISLKNSLPVAPNKGQFQKVLFRRIWRFAVGMTGITIVSLLFSQMDKVILSRTLSLENFGYYALAATISSMSISLIAGSITHAAYPQFSRLVSLGDYGALQEFYHRSCQIMSVFLIPITIILAFFSYDILRVWTGKESIALNTYILLSILAIGSGLNGLTFLPYFLQLAHGWTKLTLYVGSVMIVVLVPAIIFGAYKYGAIGGAIGWVVLTALYLPITVHLMHRRILKGEKMRWYIEDLALPFTAAILTAGTGKIILTSTLPRFETIAALSIVSAVTFVSTGLSTKTTRNYLWLYKNKVISFIGK